MQPNAVAELVSGNQAFGRPATDFDGPLQVSGNCCKINILYGDGKLRCALAKLLTSIFADLRW